MNQGMYGTGMYCPGFLPYRSSGANLPSRSYHPLPVGKTSFIKRPRSAGFAMGQGEIAIRSVVPSENWLGTHLEEHDHETSLTSTRTQEPVSMNSQTLVSDWKATAKVGLGVASRFVQTPLKKLPNCVDANPVGILHC